MPHWQTQFRSFGNFLVAKWELPQRTREPGETPIPFAGGCHLVQRDVVMNALDVLPRCWTYVDAEPFWHLQTREGIPPGAWFVPGERLPAPHSEACPD